MLRNSTFVTLFASIFISTSYAATTNISSQSDYLLPEKQTVYVNGSVVINHAAPGFEPRALPNNNDYVSNPGCYVACYSRDSKSSVYTVGDGIYVNGQVRVAGTYQSRICKPTGYENVDISTDRSFKALCNTKVATCKGIECWAGGDTGGWFGIQ